MKYAPAVLAAATASVMAAPLAHAASTTITLNALDIPVNGQVTCAIANMGPTLEIGHNQGSAWAEIGDTPSWSSRPTRVTRVKINDASGAMYEWDLVGQLTSGDAQYQGPSDPDRASAGAYKITGHIPMVLVPQYPAPGAPPPIGGTTIDGSLLPFEIDATCT